MNIYKGYSTTLFLIVITVIVIDSAFIFFYYSQLTINYSLFPTRLHESSELHRAMLLINYCSGALSRLEKLHPCQEQTAGVESLL